MTDDVRSALHDLAASADLPPLPAGDLVGRAAGRRRRRRLAAGSAAAAVLLAAPLAWSAVPQRDDVVVEDRAVDADERTVAVGRAELTVPEGWEVVELAPGEPEGCDLALDQFASPRLYVARGPIDSVVPPCAVDATGSSTVGGLAVALTGSRLEGTREDEDGQPISVNGIAGVLHVDLMNLVHRRGGEDVREQVEIRTYVFRAVDLALRLRATPSPEQVDELVGSLRATAPLIPPSPSPLPPAPPPAEAGPLPTTAVTLAFEQAPLGLVDPLTGERQALPIDDRVLGEGAGELLLAPDGDAVLLSRTLTGCSSEIVRVPLDGGSAEVLAPGTRPALRPDGAQLASAVDICDLDEAVLSVRGLATGAERSSRVLARADERIGIRDVAWSPDGRSLAVLILRSEAADGGELPERTEVRVVDVAAGQGLDDAAVLPLPGAVQLDWRGALGTLVVATAEAIVEVDPRSGEVLDELVPVDHRVGSLSADASGRHLLYVQSEPKQPGVRGQVDSLYRWSGGEPVLLAQDVSSADW